MPVIPGFGSAAMNQAPDQAEPVTPEGVPGADWESRFVVPIAIQLPATAANASSYATGKPLKRPFIIRTVIFLTDNPKPLSWLRGGYTGSPVNNLNDANAAFNVVSQFGITQGSVQSDGLPLLISGTLCVPCNIPVDDPNAALWAGFENGATATTINTAIIFLCDFTTR